MGSKASEQRLLAEMRENPKHPAHGTVNGYNIGCRCTKCKAANRQYRCKQHAKRLAEMQADQNDRAHGTTTGYDYGCRCDRCKQAYSAWWADYKEKRKVKKEAKND